MKKVFTLLTLLVAMATSAWADDLLFEYTVAGIPSPMAVQVYSYDASGTPGGKCYFNVTDTSSDNVGSKGVFGSFGSDPVTYIYAFGAGAAYVKVELPEGETFKTNDKVTIEGISTNSGYASRGYKISTSGSSDANTINTTFYTAKDTKCELTATLNATYNGKREFYIRRNSAGYLISVKVERPAIDTATPSITTDLSTTPEDVDVNVGTTLTIEAEHVTGYQWYRNTSASTTGAEAIDGATSASYSYSAPAADAESTVYFYCVVTNDNATGTKTATSAFAQVNVGSLPTLSTVSKTFFDPSDWTSQTYSTATIINNLEIKGGTVDGSSQSFDGFSVTKRIKLNKDEDGTSIYAKFKVDNPCVITVYGMTGSNKNERTLAMKIGGSDVKTMSSSTYDMGKMTYVFTGTTETDVILHTTVGTGTFNIYGITVSDIAYTMNAYGWATYVAPDNIVLDDVEGFEAYAVTGLSGTSIVKSEALKTIKSGTPLLLKGTAGTTFYLPLAGSAAATPAGNLMKAGTGAAVSAEAGKTKYVLSVKDGKAVFKTINGTAPVVGADKAYLEIADSEAPAYLDFEGEEGNTTAIEGVKAANVENGVYYNLAGQRVAQPTKGLYIVNGKKVIVK